MQKHAFIQSVSNGRARYCRGLMREGIALQAWLGQWHPAGRCRESVIANYRRSKNL